MSKPQGKKPAAPGRTLSAPVAVHEVEKTPLMLRHELATGKDRDGRPYTITAAFPAGQMLFVEREGLPTRYVRLQDLVASILDAE